MTLIDIHNIAIDNHFCCVLVAYGKLCSERQYLSLHAHSYTLSCSLTCLASASPACPAGLVNITAQQSSELVNRR